MVRTGTVGSIANKVEPTLLLGIPIGIVETPNLRNKGAQIVVGGIVLPGSPVGRPFEFPSQGTHPRVTVGIHDSTTAHDATCALGEAVLMHMVMWLGDGGGGKSGKGEKD